MGGKANGKNRTSKKSASARKAAERKAREDEIIHRHIRKLAVWVGIGGQSVN